MPPILAIIPAIAGIAGLASTGLGIANAVEGPPKTPAATPTTPAPAQINPQQAYGVLANQQSSAPGASSGLAEQQLQEIFGNLGLNSPVAASANKVQFTPAGIGPGTASAAAPQTQAFADWWNQNIVGGG